MDDLHLEHHVNMENFFSGTFIINIDFEVNCVRFRFLFDNPKEIQPLFITINIMPLSSLDSFSEENRNLEGKTYELVCNNLDRFNSAMETERLFPKFDLKKYKINVTGIESQICMLPSLLTRNTG